MRKKINTALCRLKVKLRVDECVHLWGVISMMCEHADVVACSSRCGSERKCVFWVKAWQFGDSVICHGVILGFFEVIPEALSVCALWECVEL